MTLEDKKAKAAADHAVGLNCCQSVVGQFCDEEPLDLVLRLGSGFGGGIKTGRICGALSGGVMALGLHLGSTDPLRKAEMEEPVRKLISGFVDEMRSTDCNQIIGYDVSDPAQRAIAKEKGILDRECARAISLAVQLVDSILSEKETVQS